MCPRPKIPKDAILSSFQKVSWVHCVVTSKCWCKRFLGILRQSYLWNFHREQAKTLIELFNRWQMVSFKSKGLYILTYKVSKLFEFGRRDDDRRGSQGLAIDLATFNLTILQ
jgi:hypothetical protein